MSKILILTILVVSSSWPVLGWAGESSSDKHGVIAWFEYTEKGKVVIVDVACYHRMREAMKAVNPYIVDIYKPFRLDHTKPDETLKDNQHALTQWNAVMKECVEGSK